MPAPQNLQVITSITLQDLELNFTEATEWSPNSATKSALAAFTLPFNFPIDITGLQSSIAVNYNGDDVAVLPIGSISTTTEVAERIIHLAFSGVPFNVYGDKHNQFASFLEATTVSANQSFGLVGSANTTADLAIGQVVIQNIAFDVTTSIAGLQGLNTQPTNISNLDVNHGYPDYLLITVNAGEWPHLWLFDLPFSNYMILLALYNPSNISIETGTVTFAVELESQQVGVAIIVRPAHSGRRILLI